MASDTSPVDVESSQLPPELFLVRTPSLGRDDPSGPSVEMSCFVFYSQVVQ